MPGVVEVHVVLYERVLSSFFLGEEQDVCDYSFDSLDIDIIALLQEDGRRSYAELAEHVGLSTSGCRTRVQRLRASGLIQIGAIKQRSNMTDDFLFGVGINSSGEMAELVQLLASDLALEFMARTVGRYDLIATLSFSSLRDFNHTMARIRATPGVSYCEQWLHAQIVREQYESALDSLKLRVGKKAMSKA